MPTVTANNADNKKRKRPPTFQHFPLDRAQKLKRAWIDKQKIKSKWKALKRKEGLITVSERHRPPNEEGEEEPEKQRSSQRAEDDDDDEVLGDVDSGDSDHDSGDSDHDSGDSDHDSDIKQQSHEREERHGRGHTPEVQKTRANPHPSRNPSDKHRSREVAHNIRKPYNEKKRSDDVAAEEKDGKSSLRELTRKAYSQSSLHSYRSDPLHRRRGASGSHSVSGRQFGKSEQAAGARGAGKSRGGQPNMKLRMEAALEKIKRDLT